MLKPNIKKEDRREQILRIFKREYPDFVGQRRLQEMLDMGKMSGSKAVCEILKELTESKILEKTKSGYRMNKGENNGN